MKKTLSRLLWFVLAFLVHSMEAYLPRVVFTHSSPQQIDSCWLLASHPSPCHRLCHCNDSSRQFTVCPQGAISDDDARVLWWRRVSHGCRYSDVRVRYICEHLWLAWRVSLREGSAILQRSSGSERWLQFFPDIATTGRCKACWELSRWLLLSVVRYSSSPMTPNCVLIWCSCGFFWA